MINIKFKSEDNEEINIYTDTPLDFALALVQSYEHGYLVNQDKKSIENAVRIYNLTRMVEESRKYGKVSNGR